VEGLGWLAVAWLTVFFVNLVPAFMPPTWSFLAFFLVRYDLPLLPLALGGAVAAAAGRTMLARGSRRWGTRLLPAARRSSLERLGGWLEERARWAAPVAVLLYSFGPIPSNELFIAAGLTRMRLSPITAAFFCGRVISYTFWAATARAVVADLEGLFLGHWRSAGLIAVELLALAGLLLFTRVDWPRRLGLAEPPESGA
jgi:membrane protein YqaA with SNARE-associated domain